MFGNSNVGAYKNAVLQGTAALRDLINTRYISGDSMMQERLIRYQLYWNFYKNKHWADNNDKLISFNYCRAVIDKINAFLAGKQGFTVNITDDWGTELEEDFERNYEALIEYNWRKNKKGLIVQNILQMGGVSGDAYVFLSPNTKDKFIELTLLDTRNVIPKFQNGDYTKTIGYTVVYPLYFNDKGYMQKCIEYTAETTATYYKKDADVKSEKFEYVSEINSLGYIPVVHIENLPMSDGYGGASDIIDIIKVNKIYNEMAEDTKMIIDYYAQPTTVITGAVVGQLKRGINQIWSGLPSDAQVYNLNLNTDLGASNNFLAILKNAIHDMSGVPDSVLGKMQHVSNTSAAALQILYQPLIQAADKKVLTYGDGFERINTMLTDMFIRNFPEHYLMQKIAKYIVDGKKNEFLARYRATPVFSYGLPSDRMIMLQEAQLEIQNQIASKREIMERLGKRNIPKLITEIDADVEKKSQQVIAEQAALSEFSSNAEVFAEQEPQKKK